MSARLLCAAKRMPCVLTGSDNRCLSGRKMEQKMRQQETVSSLLLVTHKEESAKPVSCNYVLSICNAQSEDEKRFDSSVAT